MKKPNKELEDFLKELEGKQMDEREKAIARHWGYDVVREMPPQEFDDHFKTDFDLGDKCFKRAYKQKKYASVVFFGSRLSAMRKQYKELVKDGVENHCFFHCRVLVEAEDKYGNLKRDKDGNFVMELHEEDRCVPNDVMSELLNGVGVHYYR